MYHYIMANVVILIVVDHVVCKINKIVLNWIRVIEKNIGSAVVIEQL